MDKPSVYIETSIVSYLAADPSRHPVTLRNQQLTHAWWNTRREEYELYTSEFVLAEAALGNPAMAARRLDVLAPVTRLASRKLSLELGLAIRQGVPLPAKAKWDALHIAFAAVEQLDILLTWDLKHIANPGLHPRMKQICARWGYDLPRLCTPVELL